MEKYRVLPRWSNFNKKDIYEKTILPIYKIYQKLTDLNSCDFGDLILHSLKILEKNVDIRDLYKKILNIFCRWVPRYKFCSSKWLNLLVGNDQNICCVGDDDQSIYSWRGAEIKNFLEFDKIYKNTKVIRLEQNYRSTQNILSVASNLISNNEKRVGKTLETTMEEGDLVNLNCFKSGKDEAIGISDEVERIKKNYSLNNIAILVRAIFQTREFEERFLKLEYPIEYLVE